MNISQYSSEVTRKHREELINQRGVTIWLTGLSASGKSTIAVALEKALFTKKYLCYVLDGDNIRLGINKDLGFSAHDRTENIRRIAEICKLIGDIGVISIVSFISPYSVDRDSVRKLHKNANLRFIEVYVKVPLSVAEARDPKGLYKRARTGEIKQFTGISDVYEEPQNPEIVLNTDKITVQEEVDILINYLYQNKIIHTK